MCLRILTCAENLLAKSSHQISKKSCELSVASSFASDSECFFCVLRVNWQILLSGCGLRMDVCDKIRWRLRMRRNIALWWGHSCELWPSQVEFYVSFVCLEFFCSPFQASLEVGSTPRGSRNNMLLTRVLRSGGNIHHVMWSFLAKMCPQKCPKLSLYMTSSNL